MEGEAYSEMPKVRRLAIFFLVIGSEQAAPILKQLESGQQKAIIREMSEVDVIDETVQGMVLQEFSGFLAKSLNMVRGGASAAIKFFEQALGTEEAEQVTTQVAPPRMLQEIQGRFSGMKAVQIWTALCGEDAQTLAFILSALDARKSAEILSLMDDEQAADVFLRMSQLGATPSDLLPRVANNVIRSVPDEGIQQRVELGGAAISADVLKVFDRERGKELLAKVDEVDEKLGKAISKEMFSFKDLVDVPTEAMQRIMREVDTSLLVVAAKSASPALMEKIYSSLSKRGAEALREEIDMQGSVPAAEIEAAQDGVLDIVRNLESEGEIVLSNEEADDV